MGVVLRNRAGAPVATPTISPLLPGVVPAGQPAAVHRLRARLLALCEEKQMHACGLLGYYTGQSPHTLSRENRAGRFVGERTRGAIF
jgi:hypothetical protein